MPCFLFAASLTKFWKRTSAEERRMCVLVNRLCFAVPSYEHLSEQTPATPVPAAAYTELPPLIMLRPCRVCRVFRHIRFELALLHAPSSLLYILSRRFQIDVRDSQCLHKLARYRFLWLLRFFLPPRIYTTGNTVLLPESSLF